MARRLFFVPEVRRGLAELTGADAEHLVRVLRVEPGDVYEISDNTRRYLARVESARKSVVVFEVTEELAEPAAAAAVYLYPALFKFDRLEWMIEKAVELNVTGIELFEAARSDRGLAQAAVKRVERWRKIGLEASQQSRRGRLPDIAIARDLRSVLEHGPHVKLFLDEDRSAAPLLKLLELHAAAPISEQRISVLLGPEGGWTDGERLKAVEHGWLPVSLGPTVLRAETAGIAALSVINSWRAGEPFASV